MFRPRTLHVRLRTFGTRLCWIAIASGLALGLGLQLAMALLLVPDSDPGRDGTGPETGLMASACIAALASASLAGVVAERVAGRNCVLNAYAAWLGTSVILMIQIAATTDVLSA